MEQGPDSELQVERPWYEILLDDLRALNGGDGLPEPHWLDREWPEWVANAGREIAKTFYPVAHLTLDFEMTPHFLGPFLGIK